MDLSAAFAVLFANVLVWGVIIGVTVHARRRSRRKKAESGMPPIEREGFLFQMSRYVKARNQRDVDPYLEYSVPLPGPLSSVGLVDSEALRARTMQMGPREEIETVGSPQTDDDVFDGVFELTSPWTDEVAAALADAETRALLMRIRDSFGGLWIDGGRIRVIEAAREADVDISIDALAAMLVQLRDQS